jgi:hypothetical protein
MHRRNAIVAVVCVVWLSTSARAEQATFDTSACARESETRLLWLIDRLDSRERYADLWWRGWIGVYAVGAAVESARAGVEDDRGKRADYIVSAIKAAGGVTRLYFMRPTARLGADPLRATPVVTAADCRARVEQGEALLEKAAHESERRWNWKAHAWNVGVNMAGAVIVAEGFDESDGWWSGAVGIAVGEAMLWSHPWKGESDLAEYQARFEHQDATPTSWNVLPYGNGLRVVARF